MNDNIQKAIELLKNTNVSESTSPDGEEVKTFYSVGRVQAIKMYRARTNCGLRQCIDAFSNMPSAIGYDGFSTDDITMIINGDWGTLTKKYNKHTLVTFLNKSPLLGDFLAYCWQHNIFS